MPMIVPLSPSGTVKLSLMLTTLSNRRYSASGSGTTPCCCSKGCRQTETTIRPCFLLCKHVWGAQQVISTNHLLYKLNVWGLVWWMPSDLLAMKCARSTQITNSQQKRLMCNFTALHKEMKQYTHMPLPTLMIHTRTQYSLWRGDEAWLSHALSWCSSSPKKRKRVRQKWRI